MGRDLRGRTSIPLCNADDGLDATVSGSVLVQVTVSLEACQVKTGDTSLSGPACLDSVGSTDVTEARLKSCHYSLALLLV